MARQQFPPTYAWPLPMKEKYEMVLRNPGVHYTIQAGRQLSKEMDELFLPLPRYQGWAMRFFIYAGGMDGGFYGCRHRGLSRHNKMWTFSTLRVVITDGEVRLHQIAHGTTFNEAKTKPKGHVAIGDIYTISVAIVGEEIFAVHYNNTFLGEVNTRRGVTLKEYNIWVQNRQHTTLSMHFSRESGYRDKFGMELHMHGFIVPVGTYVIHTSEYADEGEIEVFIWQKSWKGATTRVYSPSGKLKPGEKFTCTVQLARGKFIVSMSFESTPQVLLPNPRQPVLNVLEVSFSPNVQQLQSHYIVPF